MYLKIDRLDKNAYRTLCQTVLDGDVLNVTRSDVKDCVDIFVDFNSYGIRSVGVFGNVVIENYRTHNKTVLLNNMFGEVILS